MKHKILISAEDAKQNFNNMLNKAYNKIMLSQFREVLKPVILKDKTYLAETLHIFLEGKPDDFYRTALCLAIAQIYEKHLDRAIAKKITKKMCSLDHSKQAKDAFVMLLNIARTEKNYSEVDNLLAVKPFLLKEMQSVSGLYELVFYAAYKNNLDEIEYFILKMLKSFPENITVLQTAKSLALQHGLSRQFQTIFEQNAEKIQNKPQIKTIEIQTPETQAAEIQKETYNALFTANERALSAIALMDLTRGIAHEFGQPVTNIRFNIQYHLKAFKDKGEPVGIETIEFIFNEILLETTRIGELNKRLSPATSTETHITDFDFATLMKEVIAQEQAKLKYFNIKVDFKDKPFILSFDKTQLRQILTNLIINAIDSIEEKQKLASDNDFTIDIKLQEDKKFDNWKIIIADTGTGISPRLHTQIFNPFYTTKPPDKGQGLGLYIIKNILLKYGGNIRFDPHYTKGAKFIVHIPKKIT
jgi:signal transduction histidine kinase